MMLSLPSVLDDLLAFGRLEDGGDVVDACVPAEV